MYALQVKDLVKTFKTKNGTLRAVNDVSFSVKNGEIFGLLGVNGAGKSTTISILTGLMSPDSGTIKMFGKDYFKHEEECKQRFNVATAYYSLSGILTVKQNLEVYARLYNITERKEKINELVKRFALSKHMHTKVRSLSSGEKSRLSLVKALLNDPELLFLDECTVGLDPDMAEITRQMLLEHNAKTGCTIIFTSHYMQEVERLCHRIAFMDNGKIVKVGKAQDLVGELKTQSITLEIAKGALKAKDILEKQDIEYSYKNKKLTFQLQNEKKVLFELLHTLIHAGVVFNDIHLDKPTLEQYFLEKSKTTQNENQQFSNVASTTK